MASTDTFPLDPDFEIPEDSIEGGIARTPVLSAAVGQKLVAAEPRVWNLLFAERSTDEVEQVRDWYERFKASYFVFNHKVYVNNAGTYLPRKFPVIFGAKPRYRASGLETTQISVQLIEAAGRALQSGDYPDPAAGHPSVTLQETDVTGSVGTWNTVAHANFQGASAKENANTNTTDYMLFTYAGYGFQLAFRKNPGYGILEVLLDGVSLGTVDLYAAGDTASAFTVFSTLPRPLGVHQVKIRATNTKNASASGQLIHVDAMRYLY